MKIIIISFTALFILIGCETTRETAYEPGLLFGKWLNSENVDPSIYYFNYRDSVYDRVTEIKIFTEDTPDYYVVNWKSSTKAYILGVKSKTDLGDSLTLSIRLKNRKTDEYCDSIVKTIPLYKINEDNEYRSFYQERGMKFFFVEKEIPSGDWYHGLFYCDESLIFEGELNEN